MAADGQRQGNQVVRHRPPQVLADNLQRAPGQHNGLVDPGQLVVYQHHVAAHPRHVGTAAHGHRHIRARQHWRIIDPIAQHQHPAAFGLPGGHLRQFVFRQQAALGTVHAKLRRHGSDGGWCITRQDMAAHAVGAQCINQRTRLRTQGIAQGKCRHPAAGMPQRHHGGLVMPACQRCRQRARQFGYVIGLAQPPGLAVDAGVQTMASQIAHSVDGG